jgi:hypothetical protein
MLRLALGAIVVSRRPRLEAGMGNSPSSDPQQSSGDRQATALIDDDSTLQTMILDDFVDNNIHTLLASGRNERLRQQIGALTRRCGRYPVF